MKSIELTELEAIIEAILFISSDIVSVNLLSNVISRDKKTTISIVSSLKNKYLNGKRGIQIKEINNGYQMCTAPEYFKYIAALYENNTRQPLSQTLLETLAIVAYKQPVAKSQIEEIRGVNADHAVNKLIERNLICEIGRAETPGRPILFGTTNDFLKHFGFSNVNELPNFSELPLS